METIQTSFDLPLRKSPMGEVRHGRNSVTLIELLIVIGIVADIGSGRMFVAGKFRNEGVETNVGSKCISNVESKP